jgi:hypothetical protein
VTFDHIKIAQSLCENAWANPPVPANVEAFR